MLPIFLVNPSEKSFMDWEALLTTSFKLLVSTNLRSEEFSAVTSATICGALDINLLVWSITVGAIKLVMVASITIINK